MKYNNERFDEFFSKEEAGFAYNPKEIPLTEDSEKEYSNHVKIVVHRVMRDKSFPDEAVGNLTLDDMKNCLKKTNLTFNKNADDYEIGDIVEYHEKDWKSYGLIEYSMGFGDNSSTWEDYYKAFKKPQNNDNFANYLDKELFKKNNANSSRRNNMIKSDWERTDMASGPIWDNGDYRIIEKKKWNSSTHDYDEPYYVFRYKNAEYGQDDKQFNTLDEAMEWGDMQMNNTSDDIMSTRGNRAFLKKIVNAYYRKEMSEDTALSYIAQRKDVNIGYARQIFNNALTDKSLIQSGTMEMATDIDKPFDVDGDLQTWFDEYAANTNKSNTVGGELVRAVTQIVHLWNNEGSKIGFGHGSEEVNPAARYIAEVAPDCSAKSYLEEMLNGSSDILSSDSDYGTWVEDFESTMEGYFRDHEELFHTPNSKSLWDYFDSEDSSSLPEEIYITDDNGNQYWFSNNDGEWVCKEIKYKKEPKYKAGDSLSAEDVEDKTQEYGDIVIDDFHIAYEASGETNENGEYTSWEVTDVNLVDGLVEVGESFTFDEDTVFDSEGRELSEGDF